MKTGTVRAVEASAVRGVDPSSAAEFSAAWVERAVAEEEVEMFLPFGKGMTWIIRTVGVGLMAAGKIELFFKIGESFRRDAFQSSSRR